MSRKKTRAEPKIKEKRSSFKGAYLCSPDAFEVLTCSGYTSLSHNPEIVAAVDTIAKLIGSMTIQLMENTDNGDIRIRNALSRKMDIYPFRNMTRSTFMQWIIKTLYLDGNGNAVIWPKIGRRYPDNNDYLDDLYPVPPGMVSFLPEGLWDYRVLINGTEYDPDQVLHFVLNPDETYMWKGAGYRVVLKDVANNLKQAAATEKGFMESKWKPGLIVKVDALTEEFSDQEGRRRLLESYFETSQAGEPWLIPAEQFEVEQVKPLSLSDLAISDMVQLDKKTVASILGVPPFILGVGDYNREAWNNFVASKIMPIAQMIEQELTKKLLYKPEWFFRFNVRSLYNYSLSETISAGSAMVDRMAMTRNEWRDWVGLPPLDGLNEMLALENYIPVDRLGDQKKLIQDDEGGE